MNIHDTHEFACPYCWRANTIQVDLSAGQMQEFIVDCETCCAPIIIDVNIVGEDIEVNARRENE